MNSLSKRAKSAARGAVVATACVAAMFAAILTCTPVAYAAPEPSPIPKRWQLDITTSSLQTAVVSGKSYFFLTYRVTNNSGQDLLFAPAFELSTGEGELLRSGRDVPLEVTREIISRLNNPLIEDQISVVGTLLRGPENAKQGVIIWPMPKEHLTEISVFAAGFSGETATVEVPSVTKPGEKDKKLLRKSWMMKFKMPGDLKPGSGELFDAAESRWIMR